MGIDEIKDDICEAITERRVITFVYKDKLRVAEPYICGAGATGKPMLLAFQTGGHSSSGKFGWKLFEMLNVRNLEITETEFNIAGEERLKYDPVDKRFRKTYCAVKKG